MLSFKVQIVQNQEVETLRLVKVSHTLTPLFAVCREYNTRHHGGTGGKESLLKSSLPWGLCSLLEITLWSSRKPDTLPERSSQIRSQREVHGVALKKCRKGFIFSWESSRFCIMYYRWSKKCQGRSAPLRLR